MTRNNVRRSPRSPASPTPMILSFPRQLAAVHRHSSDARRKGERTRDSLKLAAAELLERVGYRELRVSDINERAKVSNALFYIYFKNKEQITHEVMAAFMEVLFHSAPPAEAPRDVYASLYSANLSYVERFAANPGLMRCVLQFGDEAPAFANLWRTANARWIKRVIRRLTHEPRLSLVGGPELYCAITALGVMIDGVLRLLYVDREAETREQFKLVAPDHQSLAHFLSRLWMRCLFSDDPTK